MTDDKAPDPHWWSVGPLLFWDEALWGVVVIPQAAHMSPSQLNDMMRDRLVRGTK